MTKTTSTILIVEDHEDTLELLRATVEASGRHVVTASDGEDALAMAHRELPDLVLLDVGLPKLDGLQVCRLLKGNDATKATRIVVLSVNASGAAALECGADRFLPKPFSPTTLLATLDRLLGQGTGA